LSNISLIGKHATRIIQLEDDTIVRYHDTDVVSFNRDGILLNHGGYKTATTKRRMNQVSEAFNLGFKVYQKNFEWFVVTVRTRRIYDAFGSLDMTKNPISVKTIRSFKCTDQRNYAVPCYCGTPKENAVWISRY
jgi:hypothetical protein